MLKQATPTLLPNERILDSWLANHVQSALRAVGGTLWLTDQRLLFLPHNVEVKLAGQQWQIAREEVDGVSVAARRVTHVFSGGWRRRLQIATKDRGLHMFVVRDPQSVLRVIEEWRVSGSDESEAPL